MSPSAMLKSLSPKMTQLGGLCGLLLLALGFGIASARANDLPLAAGSPIAGIAFDDRPLLLPVQRNFQMAMLTASSELGRSCGHIESYGWRLDQNEQGRVNKIFNNTVDRLRAQGFVVETKLPSSVSRDITLFTADRPDKHLISMWSAGEIGLVMVLCETSAPMASAPQARDGAPQPATQPSMQALEASEAIRTKTEPQHLNRAGKPVYENFTPVGDWVGTYTCSQGTTGGTLHIERLRGEQFEGQFHFYPTPRNPYIPTGRYAVFGDYDADSQRILVNPGKWLQRPKGYANTIMIGSFDPVGKTFSAYFQGISGCTSFEAHYSSDSHEVFEHAATRVKAHKKLAKVKKLKNSAVPKKKASVAATNTSPSAAKNDTSLMEPDVMPPPTMAPAASASPAVPSMPDAVGIKVGAPPAPSSPPNPVAPPPAAAPPPILPLPPAVAPATLAAPPQAPPQAPTSQGATTPTPPASAAPRPQDPIQLLPSK